MTCLAPSVITGRCLTLSTLLHQSQQPRNQYIRAEDDHEATRERAAVGKHDDDPAGREERTRHRTRLQGKLLCHIFRDLAELLQRRLQILDDLLRQHVRIGQIGRIFQRLIAQPADIEVDFIARDQFICKRLLARKFARPSFTPLRPRCRTARNASAPRDSQCLYSAAKRPRTGGKRTLPGSFARC